MGEAHEHVRRVGADDLHVPPVELVEQRAMPFQQAVIGAREPICAAYVHADELGSRA